MQGRRRRRERRRKKTTRRRRMIETATETENGSGTLTYNKQQT